ncbi:hypothetical protein [Embleya sp. NPDC059237]|uniref:hypothetical protein n=1 Tax=Embleya sp. NPDC059237 TaxID=3346784 RepID=UPI00369995F7
MTATVVVAGRGVRAPARLAPTTADGGAHRIAAPPAETAQDCPTCRGTRRLGTHTRGGWRCWTCRVVHPWR